MKKLNRLFAILIAVLGVGATAKADTSILQESDGWQKITALPSNLGDYYYVFVDNSQDLMLTMATGANQGNSYKTMWYQKSGNPAKDLNRVWTLESNTTKGNVSIRNVAYDHLCLQTEWNAAWNFRTHDNGGTATGVNVSWTGFTLAYAAGKWSIQNGNYPDSGYLGPWNNNIVENAEVACNKTGNAIGYFQVYAISKADFNDFYVASNSTEGQEIKVDLSFNIGNPTIEGRGIFWTSTTGCGCNYTTNKQDGTTGGFLENWSSSGPVGKIYQTLTGLPNGVYELKMKAFRNNDISGQNGVEDAVYVFANQNQVQVTTNDAETYYTVRTRIEDGRLELGLRQDTQGSQWIGLDEVSLVYLVDVNRLEALISTCESIAANSQETSAGAKATFDAALAAAKAGAEAVLNVNTDVYEIYNDLEAARQAFVRVAEPLNGIKFDYTFMVVNPKFDEGTKGWASNTGAPNWGIATNQGGAITGNYFENWKWESYTGEIYQELTGLPSGKYILTAAAFRDQLITNATDGDAVYVFANDTETLVNSGTPAFYFVEVSITAGTLRFGVKSKVVKYRWMGIDNVSLEYVEGLGLTEFINAYNAALAEAEAARDNDDYSNVVGAEKTALLAAIALQPKQTQASYESAIVALQSATATFIAAKNSYDLLDTEKQTAKGLGMSDDLISEIIDNTKTGLAVLHDLKEAEYDYVTKEFSYPVELEANGWIPEGPVGSMAGQHYDGTSGSSYLEQSGNAWGSSAWEISYKYEKTLPAGKYIFKVAGRRATGTGNTMGLVVTNVDNSLVLGSVNDFPEGDTGLGINKKGETSFDSNDEAGFANDGKGRGWQWRYVMFELSSETTVQVAVNAAATTKYQWMSFCGASLQMTEETYLEANKGGLDAPTAAAQALVNTKPMGTEENNALKAALAMTYTTGAELLAKIEALETAVANANAWVPKYNEAKAPLVAALERFEADYNDAQNGALNHMNVNRWATAISMAQAAAVAKDVTDSYDGFESATNNLVAALDAAQVSVDDYAALKSAIDKANTHANGGNWGDQPFQRPTSAKENLNTTAAQATYDAAEADGEGVTSVTEALSNGLNGIVLNAPEEGDVFELAIKFAGWQLDEKPLILADNGTGGVSIFKNRDASYYAQTMMLKQIEGNKYTMSSIAPDGTELYVSTGITSGNGANNVQIRLTNDPSKALKIEVIPTAADGLYNLKNTEADALLGCQDDKEQGGLFTVGVRNNFTITKVDMPSVTIKTPSYWATLILPFAAEIPEGLTVYSCTKAEGEVLELDEVEAIEANTPYLVCGATTDFTHTFTGFGTATATSYKVGLFTGTYVDYKTTANSNTYVLQKNNGDVAFYLVGEGEGNQPTVGAYRIYMTYEAPAGEAAAPRFSLGRGGNTTGIDNSQFTIDNSQLIIYDMHGRRVVTMEKGKMYIVNGQKIVIK